MHERTHSTEPIPPIVRLGYLAPLRASTREAIAASCSRSVTFPRQRTITSDDQGVAPRYVVSGWAARYRITPSGQRQLLNLILPGDVLFPVGPRTAPLLALTDVQVSEVTVRPDQPDLVAGLDRSRELDQSYIFSQIARLGSMSAQERLVDQLAEIFERLLLAGIVKAEGITMPLSQAQLSELLAMTPVHTNRMIRNVREGGQQFRWSGRTIAIVPDSDIDQRVRGNFATITRAARVSRPFP